MSLSGKDVGRCLAGVVLVGGVAVAAQTAAPAGVQTAHVTYGTPIVGPVQHPALVIYDGGELEVRAKNSTLNQILDDIALRTGMKVTGHVNEEHVFGIYGPASPTDVLASLLQGTGSNMLLRVSANGAPKELILTPRTGGPTPPEPAPAVVASAPPVQISGSETAAPASAPMMRLGVPHVVPSIESGGVAGAGESGATQNPNGQHLDSNGQTVWPVHHVVQQPMPAMPVGMAPR